MRAFSLIFVHCLSAGAQAVGMTHSEFSSLLSSEADGMISSLSISEADTTWTSGKDFTMTNVVCYVTDSRENVHSKFQRSHGRMQKNLKFQALSLSANHRAQVGKDFDLIR